MYLLNPKAYIPGTKMVRHPSSARLSRSVACHSQHAGCRACWPLRWGCVGDAELAVGPRPCLQVFAGLKKPKDRNNLIAFLKEATA